MLQTLVEDEVFEADKSNGSRMMELRQQPDEITQEKDDKPPPLPPKNIPRPPSLMYDEPRLLKVHNEAERLTDCAQNIITNAVWLPVN